VNLALRILNKAAQIPARIAERASLCRKMEACVTGEGVHFYPTSRIENCQLKPEAIVIGANSRILGQLIVLAHGGSIRIGESCFIGETSRIWSAASIVIGDRVLISHNVNIHDYNAHSMSAHHRRLHIDEIFTTGHPKHLDDVASAPIVIEDDVWIGFNSTILRGVSIGRGAVVSAGSFVTKDVAPYTVVFGNPARVIGESKP
jgi:acetyltransferase-like isoleucine patch superfamily enzyme